MHINTPLLLLAISPVLALAEPYTLALAASTEAQGNCQTGYHSCKDWGHSESCCGEGTDCAYTEKGVMSCCPRGTFCYSPLNKEMVFIHTSTSGSQARVQESSRTSWLAAIVAAAYGVGNWKRRWW
ncbi:hypothetical protein K440DRAFT_20718 [Wilcoxina mikolae CBS 423.85]|nr:hypothetical protein K440DRAFT_20718 [Wilcoxina mikolae CBS 423.85]